MNRILSLPIGLLTIATLSGCLTATQQDEYILSQVQQEPYLANTRMPQQFGFTIFPIKDGIDFNGAARLHPNHLTRADFAKGGVPVIKMQGHSRREKLNVLLDLSAPSSWLELGKSQEFNAMFLGVDDLHFPYRGNYNTGQAAAYAGVVTQMRVDHLIIEDIPFYIRMAKNSLGPLARGIQVPQVDAVLGYDNLRSFEYIQFDLINNQVTFSSSRPYVPNEKRMMTEAKIVGQRNYGLAVEGALFGKATPILLDFAGDYHLARGDVKVNTTRQVSMGDLVVRQVPTMLLPTHNSPPRVGRKLLGQYTITICNKQGVVYFERPPE